MNRNRDSGITKLAYQDVRRSQALREALDQHYYGQLSFSPDINPKSRAIGKVWQEDSFKAQTTRGILPSLPWIFHENTLVWSVEF